MRPTTSLAPARPAVELLSRAKAQHDLSVEDLKQDLYISYEMAAHRLTNPVTRHLDLPVHFLRADEDGVIWKAYENNGMPFPTDADGVIEGQRACRMWGTRQAFSSHDQFSEHAQYTTSPAGEYWCVTQVEVERRAAVTIGATAKRPAGSGSRDHQPGRVALPRGRVLPAPARGARRTLAGPSLAARRADGHILATFPAESFTGVELSQVYDFLELQTPAVAQR